MFKRLVASVSVILAGAVSASAATLTIGFSADGVFDRDGSFDALGLVAAPISGTISYDDGYDLGPIAVDRNGDVYGYAKSLTASSTWSVAGVALDTSAAGGEVWVRDVQSGGLPDLWKFNMSTPIDWMPGITVTKAYIMARDYGQTALTDLSPSVTALNTMDTTLVLLFSKDGQDYRLQSNSVIFNGSDARTQQRDTVGQLTPVPLPASGFLMLVGAGGLIALRRRNV